MKKILTILSLLALMLSCSRAGESPELKVYKTVHYSVKASGASPKASLDESRYIFESGDRLFISHYEGGEAVLYGFLTLMSGASESTAFFEGDLACDPDFDLTVSTPVDVVLVGENDCIHTISSGKVSAASYPDDQMASSFAEAVSKYSHFTASGTFGSEHFTLAQQSAFINFDLTLDRADFPSDIEVGIRKGSDLVRSVTVTPEVLNSSSVRARFTIPFEGGSTLLGGTSYLEVKAAGSNTPVQLDPIVAAADFVLAANNYYTVKRPIFSWEGFFIKATEDGTVISMRYASGGDGIVQYSLDQGASWTEYTVADSPINLDAGDVLCLRGTRSSYNCYQGSKPMFTSAGGKLCLIGGNIMSLICNSDWSYKTVVGEDAFNCAFSKSTGANENNYTAISYIDIDPDYKLLLPALSFSGKNCYKGMFKGCTSLTIAPDLPAPEPQTGGNGRYQLMFAHCTSLRSVKCLATSGVNNGNCFSDWLRDVNATGTFTKLSGVSDWTSGTSGIPAGWTVVEANQ